MKVLYRFDKEGSISGLAQKAYWGGLNYILVEIPENFSIVQRVLTFRPTGEPLPTMHYHILETYYREASLLENFEHWTKK